MNVVGSAVRRPTNSGLVLGPSTNELSAWAGFAGLATLRCTLMIRELEMKKRSTGSETAIGRDSVLFGSETVVVVCGIVVCGELSPNGISALDTC